MQTELSQYTAVIGIDWADKKHDVCVQDLATGRRQASQVRHRAEDLDEWAAQTVNKSYWAGLYYRQQRAKGCSHQAAVRALAFKWIRILYRCWKTRTPYDESRYLRALQERGSSLLNMAEVA